MIKLIDVAKVKTRMALPDVAAADPAINEAIESAHLRVQSELDARFDKGTNTDVFYLDHTKCGYVVPDGYFRLRLKEAFIRPQPDVVVLYSTSMDFTGAAAIPAADYYVDPVIGFVYVKESYEGCYVQVQYDHGWQAGEENNAPGWLKEAIISYVPVAFYKDQTTNKISEAKPSLQLAIDHVVAVLSPYQRKRGFTINPVY